MAPAPRTCRAAHLFSIKAVTWMGLLGLHDQKPRGTARRVSSLMGRVKMRAHTQTTVALAFPHTAHATPFPCGQACYTVYSVVCLPIIFIYIP